MSQLKTHLYQHNRISEAKITEIKEIVNRLKKFEPIQYILGETEFYGLKFKVTPAVLIPRPETEELVDWILRDSPGKNSTLLDIGTGSGCIPVALAKHRPDVIIEGWDISEEALIIARENAEINHVNVSFSKVEMLSWREFSLEKTFDIIISNPPYVTKSEQKSMLKNVTEYEPHLALFVPDNDPMIFYREIADFASGYLNPGGYLYLEINEKLGDNMARLLNEKHFKNIELRKDINGRDRMIRCKVE